MRIPSRSPTADRGATTGSIASHAGQQVMWELLVVIVFIEGVTGLRLDAINVPEMTTIGEHIRLSCNYRLEGDQLYSIKWYKDNLEFFRYVPTDRPPGQFFPLQGIKLDLDRSLNGTLYIKDVDYGTSGIYRCEVSADSPSFQTVFAEKALIVQEDSGKAQRSGASHPLFLLTAALIFSLV